MKMIQLRNLNDMTKENMNKFWGIFIQWMSTKQIRKEYFTEEYNRSTVENFFENIEFFNTQYLLYYSKEYPFWEISNCGLEGEQLKEFLNIAYNKWVEEEKKDKFAAEINKQLRKADVSYMLGVNQLKNSDNQLDEDILINTKFVEDPIIRKELLIDLMAILTHMQGNVIYRGQNENTLNDGVRDGLKITRRYQVHDQSRHGESESGIDAGELDLLISSKNEDLPIAVVEALILNGMDKTKLKKHIDKALTKYDPQGCPIIVILIYSRYNDFSKLASSIADYLFSYNYPYEVKDSFEEINTGYTESRHWKLDLIRSNKDITIHIIDYNMI